MAFENETMKPIAACLLAGALCLLGFEDIRFTTKGNVLYAVLLGWPEKQAVIKSLPSSEKLWFGEIGKVQLLGVAQPLKFSRNDQGLTVEMPREKTGDHAFVLKISGKP